MLSWQQHHPRLNIMTQIIMNPSSATRQQRHRPAHPPRQQQQQQQQHHSIAAETAPRTSTEQSTEKNMK
jgi:hypothetical protein